MHSKNTEAGIIRYVDQENIASVFGFREGLRFNQIEFYKENANLLQLRRVTYFMD